MMQYPVMEVLTYERQADFLADAEQQRFERALAPNQPHPLIVWIGQQLVVLGEHLQGEKKGAGIHPRAAPVTRARSRRYLVACGRQLLTLLLRSPTMLA